MDGRFTSFGIITWYYWCCISHTVILRSIDQRIQDAETNYEENYDGPMSKLPSRVWYDYELQGRTEELVKLQLDMIVTKETWNKIIDTDNALPSRNTRNAIKDLTRLWPRKIAYHLDEHFDISEKYLILQALDHWEEHTCVKFIESNNSQHVDIIEFAPINYGCESAVGRMRGRQPINLAKFCMYVEVIMHEIGHALGLYHEHMRADRDNYVTINYQNINESLHPQFDKLRVNQYNDYQKPYDYESIMHYGKLFFSANRSANLLTMVPTDEVYLDIIGEAPTISYNDVRIVNELYTCSAGCIEKPCSGGGFLGKNCECYCRGADSYTVVLCEHKEPCDTPDINGTVYNVSTPNHQPISVATDTYVHGSSLIVNHRNHSCGYQNANFTCNNGTWEGDLPVCMKECTVEDLGEDYSQIHDGYVVEPGYKLPSGDGVYIKCSNMTDDYDDIGTYISCSDGVWDTHDIVCAKECTVEDLGEDYSQIYDGYVVEPGYKLPSGDGVYIKCSNMTDDYDDIGTYISCSDGVWDTHDIVCLKEHRYCPMIINSTVKGSFNTGFKITCLEGFALETHDKTIDSQEMGVYSQERSVDSQEGAVDSQEGAIDSQEEGAVDKFTCTWAGLWKPYRPMCAPASCKVPEEIIGDMYNKVGDAIFGGSVVTHEQAIEYYCPRGHVPDEAAKFSCKYGKFDTPGGEIPACRKVTCPDPDVQGTTYSPKSAVYAYGDEVQVHWCRDTLEFVGSHKLKCLKDGTWSSTALCRQFCLNGKETLRVIKNREFVEGIPHKLVGLSSHTACQKRCRTTTSFLCRSFVYGIENRKRYCRLYRLNADEHPKLTKDRSFWTISVRMC